MFFFIFINNIMGLIPVFPGGGNVTGNIAITLVLALCTFIAVNVFGTKEYWKEILWPEVPMWLKCPVPIMPAIELFGIFTKPFALMIRLFANIMAGHSIIRQYGSSHQHIDEYCIGTFQHLHELCGNIGSVYSSVCIHHAFGSIYRHVESRRTSLMRKFDK